MSSSYDVSSFDVGKEETRFQQLLDSDSSLGRDLGSLFDQLKQETHGGVDLEDLPEDNPFRKGAEGLGPVGGKVEKRIPHLSYTHIQFIIYLIYS